MSEVVFQGTHKIALDAKGRITVPARVREQLAEACEGLLTLTRHPTGHLWVFPRPRWLKLRDQLLRMPMNNDPWKRIILGSAADVEIDGGARVLVPPELREAAALSKDVHLVGMGYVLELWDVTRQKEHEQRLLSEHEMPASIGDTVMQP